MSSYIEEALVRFRHAFPYYGRTLITPCYHQLVPSQLPKPPTQIIIYKRESITFWTAPPPTQCSNSLYRKPDASLDALRCILPRWTKSPLTRQWTLLPQRQTQPTHSSRLASTISEFLSPSYWQSYRCRNWYLHTRNPKLDQVLINAKDAIPLRNTATVPPQFNLTTSVQLLSSFT